MEIFGKHIFSTDADWFLNLSKEEKKQWILNRTTQTNETLIDEFLDNLKPSTDENCLTCGTLNNIIHNPNDSNISKGNDEPIEAVDKPIDNSELSSGNSVKRPKNTKRRKD